MSLFGLISGGLGIASSLFGGKSKPAKSQSVGGWAALPQEVKNFYLQTYLPDVQKFYQNPTSQGVQSAYDSYAGGIQGLSNELPQYMNLFKQNVDDPTFQRLQQEADMEKNRLNAQAVNSGLGGLFNSNLGIQLSQLQKNADDRKAEYAYQMNQNNLNNALNLRNQTLGELLKSGDMQYNKLGQLAQLLNAFQGGTTSSSVGASTNPNFWDKLSGGATALGALGQNQGWW